MPSDNSRFRLLVKTAAGPAGVRLSLNGQRFNFTMTPLQAAQRRGVARMSVILIQKSSSKIVG
jgi:hypothetical protein